MKRMTRQRAAIYKTLFAASRPLSVEEILSLSAKEIPEINLSTVYRNLKILIQENKIALIEVPGAGVHYEKVEPKHHHHFLCDICNRLFSIPGCPGGLFEILPKGFELRGHSLTLNGFCGDCARR